MLRRPGLPHPYRSMTSCLLTLACAAACTSDAKKETGVPRGSNYGADIIGYKSAIAGADPAPTTPEPRGDVLSGGAYDGASAGTGAAYAPSEYGTAGAWSAGYDAGLVVDDEDGGTPTWSTDAAVTTAWFDAGSVVEDDGGAAWPSDAGVGPVAPSGAPENPYQHTATQPASTFSIDVDTGSYTLTRGYVTNAQLPPPESVRIEELINYFHFHYAQPEAETPFALYTELSGCPWNQEHQLLLLGVQGQEVALVDQPPANLVFLIDVSGSMQDANKLPLLKKGFRMLVRQLRDVDRVSIVTYAGTDRVALESTPGSDKDTILAALDALEASGSTNGEGGIQKAYELASQHFMKDGNNRVILATDGDFNVGIESVPELKNFIAQKRDTGVFLSVYGFGDAWNGGNYEDETLEQLADNGNGIYFYIDGAQEARRAFLQTVSGSLLTVAKDVKLQVEFNTDEVAAYRLIGYENRVLENRDFNDDGIDAGELGAGLSVTALFEIVPAGSGAEVPIALPGTVPTYDSSGAGAMSAGEGSAGLDPAFEPVSGDDVFAVRIRYKDRSAEQSRLITRSYDGSVRREQPTPKFAFAAAVAELGMQLRRSQYVEPRATRSLLEQVDRAKPLDAEGAVDEFHRLVESIDKLRR